MHPLLLLASLGAATLSCRTLPSSPAMALAASQPGVLTIHQINVQQGDCTLIVGPDGTTLLIDAGKPGKGSGEVVPYLASIGIQPSDGLDFMVCTHRDDDHLGGLDEVIEADYDVRTRVWDNGSTKTGGQITEFLNAARDETPAGAVQRIPLGQVINLGHGATATCVAVGGEVLGVGTVAANAEENDQSVAILVQYGDFEYITAGDLGGGTWAADASCTQRSTDQANIESPLARALMPGGAHSVLTAAGVEVLDVNHHGSESSSNHEYMNLLSPTVAVINTGPGQGSNYHHPREDVVERVLRGGATCVTAPPALVLQTEEGFPIGAGTSFDGFCVGDIVITTTGSGSFAIRATGQVTQGPDERAAAGLIPGPRVFPLDGATMPQAQLLLITEIMKDPASVPDSQGEWFEVLNPGTTPIDINGWTIRDDGADTHAITNGGPLIVPPGGRSVLGRNANIALNGGYQAHYVYSGFNLANSADEIVLLDTALNEVDRVAYTGSAPWPNVAGRSITLTNPSQDNANGANWGIATVRGGSFGGTGADFGTPGSP